MACDIREWLVQHACWATAHDDEPLTHVLLDGGRARVPLSLRDEFLKAYASHVDGARTSGRRWPCVVERTVGTYRMFADFDVKDVSVSSVRDIVETAIRHAPSKLRTGSGVTLLTRTSSAGGKTGAHLVWRDVYVTDGIALALRQQWVGSLKDHGHPEFDRIIDAAVYRRSGLRMPWSRKVQDDDDAYAPRAVLKFQDDSLSWNFEDIEASTLDLIQMSSLRAGLGHPKLEGVDEIVSATSRAVALKGGHIAPAQLTALARALPRVYRSDAADAKTSIVRGDRSTMIVLRLRSRYCHNVGREHSSNTVYIVAVPDGSLFQCCFSPRCKGKKTKLKGQHRLPEKAFAYV